MRQQEPLNMEKLQHIRELDLSPFVVSQIEADGVILRFRSSLTLSPIFDSDDQRIRLEYVPLGIDVSAVTRDELREELQAEILTLWREYAIESDDVLSPAAISLKQRLLQALDEVTNAEG